MKIIGPHCKETYIPMETIQQMGLDGEVYTTERPLIPGIIFFRCDSREVIAIREILTDKAFVYHRQTMNKREPAPISDRELYNFRRFVSNSLHCKQINSQAVTLSKGHRVRVIEGPLKGFEGTICRVKGNRHLVVAVTGICAVMLVDYIPQTFLQKIN